MTPTSTTLRNFLRETSINVDRNEPSAVKDDNKNDFYCFFGTVHVSVITAFIAVLVFWSYGSLFPYLAFLQLWLPFGISSVFNVYFALVRIISVVLVAVGFGFEHTELLVPHGILQVCEIAAFVYEAVFIIIYAPQNSPIAMGFWQRFSVRTEMTVKMALILAVLVWALWITVRCYRYVKNSSKTQGVPDPTIFILDTLEDHGEWLSLYGHFHITTLTRILTTLSSVATVFLYLVSNDTPVKLGSMLGFLISIQVATSVVIHLGLKKIEADLMTPFMVAQVFQIGYNVYHLLAVAQPNASIFLLIWAIVLQVWAVRTVQKCYKYLKACGSVAVMGV